MTTAEVNAAVAKAKGWNPLNMDGDEVYSWHDPCDNTLGTRGHRNPTDDPREWSRLMREMLEAKVNLFFSDDGDLEACKGYPDEPGSLGLLTSWKPSIGEAVCRAWLRWKGVSDA